VRSLVGLLAVLTMGQAAVAAQAHTHAAAADALGFDVVAFAHYVRTFGTRADYQLGSVNLVMGYANLPFAGGTLGLRGMASAEPLTATARGVPQPLQAVFEEDGQPVTDHAHPDRWLMELSATYDRTLAEEIDLRIGLAAVGAPALGPDFYKHRPAAALNPSRPLAHHYQDGSHASFGVVTAGLHSGRVRVEASAFNDRVPDREATLLGYQDARLDAFAGRVTLDLSSHWQLVAWLGYLPSISGAHAHGARHRFGAAASYSGPAWLATVIAGADRPLGGNPLATVLAEATRTWSGGRDAAFTRFEYVRRTAADLALVGSVSPELDVGAASLGYLRRLGRPGAIDVRVGVQGTAALIPAELAPFYGSKNPLTVSGFLRLQRASPMR
jgi:hypothetical protein